MGGKDAYRNCRDHLHTKHFFFVDQNTGKKLRAQGNHREFCPDGSVATLNDCLCD